MNLLSDSFLLGVGLSVVYLVLEVVYFKFAERKNIIDKPNQRSSHFEPVIRGGGIIFIVAVLVGEAILSFDHIYFTIGAVLIAAISFLDDVSSRSAKVRFGFQLVAILFLLLQVGFLQYPILAIALAAIIGVGIVNAFNFMDGINGITGIYAMVNLVCLGYVNRYSTPFVDEAILISLVASVAVFLWFNFRRRARCFAGDVGSITLAFVQIFLVLVLIDETNNFAWLLMFTIYGADAVFTLMYRLIRKENIFEAHRSHLYQYMANELELDHRWVSGFYGAFQLVINAALILLIPELEFVLLLGVTILFAAIYLSIRRQVILYVNNKQSLS